MTQLWLYTHSFYILFHYGLLQEFGYSSLWYTVGLCCLSIPNVMVCMYQPQNPSPFLPSTNPLTSLFSVSLVLICRQFHLYILYSSHKWYYLRFVFLVATMLLKITLFHSFYGQIVFHCNYMYVPHLLYPIPCWWACKLFPCLGYCEQCCYEHRGVCICLN